MKTLVSRSSQHRDELLWWPDRTFVCLNCRTPRGDRVLLARLWLFTVRTTKSTLSSEQVNTSSCVFLSLFSGLNLYLLSPVNRSTLLRVVWCFFPWAEFLSVVDTREDGRQWNVHLDASFERRPLGYDWTAWRKCPPPVVKSGLKLRTLSPLEENKNNNNNNKGTSALLA